MISRIDLKHIREVKPESISGHDRNIYHLLRGAFGQCISIPQIIDFDILNVVAIRDIHITINIACTRARIGVWRPGFSDWAACLEDVQYVVSRRDIGKTTNGADWRDFHMLDAFLGLNLSINASCGGS